MLLVKQFYHILLNSFSTAMNSIFFIILHLGGTMLLLFLGVMPSFTELEHLIMLREQQNIIILILGFIAMVLAFDTIFVRDFKRGCGAILFSRPINTYCLIAAKFMGAFLAALFLAVSFFATYLWIFSICFNPHRLDLQQIIMFFSLVLFAIIASAFYQYFFQKKFIYTCNLLLGILVFLHVVIRFFAGSQTLDWQGLSNLYCILPVIGIFGAFLLPIAVNFDTVALLFSSIVLFFIGTFAAPVISFMSQSWQDILLSFLPNWQKFWVIDYINTQQIVPSFFLKGAVVQFLLFIILFVTISSYILSKKEVKI